MPLLNYSKAYKSGKLDYQLRFLKGQKPTLPVLEPGKCVMEVKFTEFLPQFVRDILPDRGSEFTAVSKYVLCYEKTEYMNSFKYWYEN